MKQVTVEKLTLESMARKLSRAKMICYHLSQRIVELTFKADSQGSGKSVEGLFVEDIDSFNNISDILDLLHEDLERGESCLYGLVNLSTQIPSSWPTTPNFPCYPANYDFTALNDISTEELLAEAARQEAAASAAWSESAICRDAVVLRGRATA